jgi:tetratricopeptide (TPR) repeat protein
VEASGRCGIHELLRQYGGDQLGKTGDGNKVQDAHMYYYLAALHEREADLKGHRQIEALDEIEADFENVQAAWERAVQERTYKMIDRAVMSLALFCDMRTHWTRGYEVFDIARQQLAPQIGELPHPVYGKVLIRYNRSDQVKIHFQQALTIAREHHNQIEEAECLVRLSRAMLEDKAYEQTIALMQESLATAREVGEVQQT